MSEQAAPTNLPAEGNVPAVLTPIQEEIFEFRKAELEKFMRMNAEFPDIAETVNGPMCILDGEEYPVVHQVFKTTLVQPGHCKKHPHLKPHKGKFCVEDIDRSWEELHLIPVGVVRHGRSLFDSEFKDGVESKPVCFSTNGMYPSPRGTAIVSDRCAELGKSSVGIPYLKPVCPSAVYEEGRKTPCSEYVEVVFLALNINMAPLKFTFKGFGLKNYKLGMTKYLKKSTGSVFIKETPYDSYFKVTITDKDTWVEPEFTLVTDPSLNLKKFIPLVNHYLTTVLKEEALRTEKEYAEDVKALATEPTIDDALAAKLAAEAKEAGEVDFSF